MITDTPPTSASVDDSDFDYVIVGAGAGGVPLAARLAECRHSVLVLEAGPDHCSAQSSGRVREVTSCPALHAPSTEDPDVSWEFFVDHYTTPVNPDPKWYAPGNGLFYPRATGIGGCTLHNAMITIVGPGSDWDALAWYLNDPSWGADVMRGYFCRLERCEYHDRWQRPRNFFGRLADDLRWLFGQEVDPTVGRHGFDGWLHTSTADAKIGLADWQLVRMLKAALVTSIKAGMDRPWRLFQDVLRDRVGETFDPNHFRRQREHPEGVAMVPLAVVGRHPVNGQSQGHRSSPVPRLTDIATNSQKLTIATNCLATKVILEPDPKSKVRAIGVEYLHGERLYEATPNRGASNGNLRTIHAKKEVILCGGAFNTPQLLMLSGIGPKAELIRLGVECKIDSPGVGENLQDRYEVTVVSKMQRQFDLLQGAKFQAGVPAADDSKLQEWRDTGGGLYSSNGAVLGILKRSRPDLDQPDLFIFGIPLKFLGYAVGYSKVNPAEFDRFTWAILKGHTQNHCGTVRLVSTDPLKRPRINFNYFGTVANPPPATDPDLDAVLDGVKFVREIAKAAGHVVTTEANPAGDPQVVATGTDDGIRNWIRQVCWGHHACGTCRMGRPTDPLAVADSRFRVLGEVDASSGRRVPVRGLRIVDASIFPTIPGYFIVSNLYMASEKAADVIDADAGKS